MAATPSSGEVPSSNVTFALLAGLEQCGDGAFVIEQTTPGGDDPHIVYANAAVASALGRAPNELLGSSLSAVFAGARPDVDLRPLFTAKEPGIAELELELDGGRAFELRVSPVRDGANPIRHWLGLLRDVTQERQRASAELERERLRSVELLAAGMAHEINNPLASITTNLEWLVMQLPGLVGGASSSAGANPELASTISAALVDALAGAERVEGTIRYLSMLSGLEDPRRELLDVRELLEGAIAELDGQFGRDVEIVRRYADVPPVMASEQRLKQAFINLLLNAAQAIGPDAARREITLRVSGDERVRVEIEDSGGGVPEAVRERLFSPFVTTKPVGLGKGLGLFLCRLILEAAGGSVGFSSEPKRGAVFWVELPRAQPGG